MKGISLKIILLSIITFGSLSLNIILWLSITNSESTNMVEHNKKLINTSRIKSTDNTLHTLNKEAASSNNATGLKHQVQEQLKNHDYQALSEVLLKAGIPVGLVRKIVLFQIEKNTTLPNSNNNFWRYNQNDPSKSAISLIESNASKREKLVQVFGEDIKNDPEFHSLFRPYQQKLGFLSSDKQVKLYELQLKAMTDRTQTLSHSLEGSIEELLGPTDYYEYQLRESPTAKILQQELAAFDYSEQEYRELYRIKQESTQQTDSSDMLVQSGDVTRGDFILNGQSRAKNTAEEERIQAYLGEERYSDYKLVTQPDFKRTLSIAQQNNLQKSDAIAIYDILKRSRSKLTKLHQNVKLSSTEKSNRINTLYNTTNSALSDMVGDTIAQDFVSDILRGPQLR